METCENDVERTICFLENISGCDADTVIKDFYKWKKETRGSSKNDWVPKFRQMVSVDFQIQGAALFHRYDLQCFSERMDHVFQWHTDMQMKRQYVAPYFCFVQSSGMGKTKIMHEYKKEALKANITSLLILPSDTKFDQDGYMYRRLDLGISVSPNDTFHSESAKSRFVAERIFRRLDRFLYELQTPEKRNELQKVALLFDESQLLLKAEFGLEAFRFRCVRLWLQEKRHDVQVVAVFAGTNLRFATMFDFGPDERLKHLGYTSRDAPGMQRVYHDRGKVLYPPFYQTTTMGSCLPLLEEAEKENGAAFSEYERAVYYGRPLFAHMSKENRLDDNLIVVLRRMVLGHPDKEHKWRESLLAWISLLPIRVQMGQTTVALASDLVAESYAIFCGYHPESKAILLGHFPDPVCARLAMCLMDDTLEIRATSSNIIKGASKKWWAGKLSEIISTGMVIPENGNLEVVVAWYMLFCGDLLRKRINEENNLKGIQLYTQFSVSLDAWLQLMMSGGKNTQVPIEECEVSVGFIQLCRNPLRSYRESWASLADQSFLKHIFESGIALYVFPNCPLIDIVVPLRITPGTNSKTEYISMFVSIKCGEGYSDKELAEECEKMKERAVSDKLDKALCLLILFASDPIPNKKLPAQSDTKHEQGEGDRQAYELKEEGEKISSLWSCDGVVSRFVRVPLDDAFGLTDVFKKVTLDAAIHSELFSSHPYLMAHGQNENKDLEAKAALPQELYAKYRKDYTLLRKAMTTKEKDDAPSVSASS